MPAAKKRCPQDFVSMRRITLWLLLALLPMRLWAQVWMPAQHPAAEQAAPAAQPCHHADASELPMAAHDGAACADCAACDLCHQSASLQFFAWPLAQAWPQGLPDWLTPSHPARHWPPPIEPPRA
jgi:hypothetical protein